jgi:hypothetical protein
VDDRLRTRFEAKVDRSGRHHRWMGSRTADGAGKLKVDGRTVSARRVAWELERGPLSPTVPVNACPHDPACVRVEHLFFRGEAQTAGGRRRAARGTGSKTEVRQGVWKLTVTAGAAPTAAFVACIARCGLAPRRRPDVSLLGSLRRCVRPHSPSIGKTAR